MTEIHFIGICIVLLTLTTAQAAVHLGSDSSSNTEERFRPEDFNHIPPDVFGSNGLFQFAMEVPLYYEFPVAQWEATLTTMSNSFS